MSADLLIEIGLEELPPKAMQPLAESFACGIAGQLASLGIAHGNTRYFATPRRLAILVEQVADHSRAEQIEKKGPTLILAYDDNGEPSKAGEGFARSVGASLDTLSVEDSDKGKRLVFRETIEGRPLSMLLQTAVDETLNGLPIPKRMRWSDSDAAFVRPVHWLVSLHGDQVIPLRIFGVNSARRTRGHRFHHPSEISLDTPLDYLERLRDPGYVIADIDARRACVIGEVELAAQSLGGRAMLTDELVDEVTALVEWPIGIAGRFDPKYLTLPREVLTATLEGHQRFFAVQNSSHELLAGFVTVANIDSRDRDQVITGNERVVHPRLADALFFWNQDRRQTLAERMPALARVSFQQSLGTLADKSNRVARIAVELAQAAGADLGHTRRASNLAKTDLLTEMVKEFPELQGVMGFYYAKEEGEPAPVATAIAEQYAPIGSGAAIAQTAIGRCLSIADRLDTLAGIFATGKRPTGDKDPFGLRRAAIGVLRTLIEGGISCDLKAILKLSLSIQPIDNLAENTFAELWTFHMERLRGYYQEREVPAEYFEAVASMALSDVLDFDRRIKALISFAKLESAAVVCSAHKRIRNILKRNADEPIAEQVNESLLTDPAEESLYAELMTQRAFIESAFLAHNYVTAFSALVNLAKPLDVFFEDVMVMTNSASQRANRLALLSELDQLCRRVADVSCLSSDIS